MSACTFSNNHDKPPTPVGALPDTAVTFNRLGAFFQDKYSAAARRLMNGLPQDKKVDRYKGGTQPAQLTIALHELAHLLEKIGPGHVPGFVPDGADPLRKLSEQNTRLLLSNCRLMIERTP